MDWGHECENNTSDILSLLTPVGKMKNIFKRQRKGENGGGRTAAIVVGGEYDKRRENDSERKRIKRSKSLT